MRNKLTSKKLKAFTLTEVLVTMAISSIVVIITYMAYEMLNTYFRKVDQTNEIYSERLSFRTIFTRDLDLADSIISDLQHELLLYQGTELLTWQFHGDSISRGDQGKDFMVGSYSMSMKNYSPRLISEVQISWPDGTEDSIRFLFQKKYPISTEIN